LRWFWRDAVILLKKKSVWIKILLRSIVICINIISNLGSLKIVADRDNLWNAFLDGDRKAFEEIYVSYVQELINYGYRITNNRELIKDSVQELFVSIWNSRDNLGNTTSIRFYLFRSLRNRLMRQLQREEGRIISTADNDFKECDYEVIIDNDEEYYRVARFELSLPYAIDQLPARQREVIQLRFYHDFEIEEITEIMSISNQSVRNTLHKAIFRLRNILNSKNTDFGS
jgi:RNA polymerase sigma factor (sigma-70 family)